MFKYYFLLASVIVVTSQPVLAEDDDQADAAQVEESSNAEPADTAGTDSSGSRKMSGMSVLGNEEAPKSLVIVPWKSSELGDDISLSDTLDDRARPVDKEVFMRELRFYQIRSGEQT